MKNKYNFWLIILIICQLSIINCQLSIAQFNFIGRKINPYHPKPVPSIPLKSGNTIPSLDFKFDSIRSLSELTTGNGESYPWISLDGNRVYYSEARNRWIPSQTKIYMAEKQPGQYKFSNPHPLSINSKDTILSNWSAWLTQDELNIYFQQWHDSLNTSVLFHAKRDSINQDFSSPVKVKLIGKHIRHIIGPSLTQDSMNLYLNNYLDSVSINLISIYIFSKTAVNEYTLADSLNIPNGYSPSAGTLTTNGLKYFLSLAGNDGYKIFMYSRDSLNEKFSKLYYINNSLINNNFCLNEVSPYLSISDSIFLFVKNIDGSYFYDSLFIAYNFSEFDNITEYIKKSGNVNIFPNPVNNYLEIIPVNIYHSFDYFLTNLSGQIVKAGSFACNTRLDVSSFSKGIYILKLIDKTDNFISYHKILKI